MQDRVVAWAIVIPPELDCCSYEHDSVDVEQLTKSSYYKKKILCSHEMWCATADAWVLLKPLKEHLEQENKTKFHPWN